MHINAFMYLYAHIFIATAPSCIHFQPCSFLTHLYLDDDDSSDDDDDGSGQPGKTRGYIEVGEK